MPNPDPQTPNPRYDAVGIGIAYTDIIAYVPHALLQDFSIPLEFARVMDEAEMRVLKGKLDDPEFHPGGLVANTLAGVTALGGKTAFFAKLGEDREGEIWSRDFKQRGMNFACDLASGSLENSPVCAVLLTPDGKRSYGLYHGCGAAFTAKDFEAFDFTQSRFVMTNGSFLIGCANAADVMNAVEGARKKGCRTVISLSDVGTWKGHESLAARAARSFDIVIGNKAEMAAFYDATRHDATPGQLIVTTYGEEGASALMQGSVMHIPAQAPKTFVSSVGAGDQFLAGLLRGLSLDYPLERSLMLGVHCATSILMEMGARPTQSWQSLLAKVA